MKARKPVKKLFCLMIALGAVLTAAGCAREKQSSAPEATVESTAAAPVQLSASEPNDETIPQTTEAAAPDAPPEKIQQLTNGCWVMNTFQYDGFWLYRFSESGTGTIETYSLMTKEIMYNQSEHFTYRIEGEKIFLNFTEKPETEFRFTPDESVLETTVDFATNAYEKNEIAIPMFHHDAPPDMDAVHQDYKKVSQYKSSAQ